MLSPCYKGFVAQRLSAKGKTVWISWLSWDLSRNLSQVMQGVKRKVQHILISISSHNAVWSGCKVRYPGWVCPVCVPLRPQPPPLSAFFTFFWTVHPAMSSVQVYYNCVRPSLQPRDNFSVWMKQQRAVTKRHFLTSWERQWAGKSIRQSCWVRKV